jgi:hypothetical protein
MTSNLFDIITRKSKNILFEASRKYNSQGYSVVPYEELIVSHEDYPDNYFLVHKNMIFVRGLEDSSYDVYRFDKEGNILDKKDYPKFFFRDMKVIKKIS